MWWLPTQTDKMILIRVWYYGIWMDQKIKLPKKCVLCKCKPALSRLFHISCGWVGLSSMYDDTMSCGISVTCYQLSIFMIWACVCVPTPLIVCNGKNYQICHDTSVSNAPPWQAWITNAFFDAWWCLLGELEWQTFLQNCHVFANMIFVKSFTPAYFLTSRNLPEES